MNADKTSFDLSCPVQLQDYPHVLLAHGGGGQLTHTLIEKLFLAALGNPLLESRHDSAVFTPPAGKRLAFTTDSYVVRPLFFPGGDIGALAVNGTINDLAMSGARPLHLSAGFILEEGLPMETLWRVVKSMRRAADAAGVTIVAGDTKVVDRGKGDQVFINTAGIGVLEHERAILPAEVRPGDTLILSGDLGRHGMAIMSVREGLSFETQIASDCAPLHEPIAALMREGIDVHCMRDLTRGGLAAALNEIAAARRVRIEIYEHDVPVGEDVRGACEILGLDPLYVANEGRFVVFVGEADSDRTIQILRSCSVSANACAVGRVGASGDPRVVMKTAMGTSRIVDMLSGEQLPRIC